MTACRFSASRSPQLILQLLAQFWLALERIGRVAGLNNVLEPRLHGLDGLGMAVNVKLVARHRIKHQLSHITRDIAAQIAAPQPVSLAAAQAPSAEPSIEESFGEIIGWEARPEQELESVSGDTASEHATVELEATVELDETMAFDENIALDDTVTAEVAAYVELDDDLERYKPRLVA